jgi:DUF2993 family protein
VIVVLLVAADRIGVVVAQHIAANKIKSSQRLDHTPTVTVRGFPFLTQLAGETLNRVDVTARDFVTGDAGHTIRIRKLSAELHKVHLSGLSSARADTARASALIDYSALSAVLGVALRYGGPTTDGQGRVATTASATVLGQPLSGTATAEIKVAASNVLEFADAQATVNGVSLPNAAIADLTKAFDRTVSLQGLPFRLTLQSVQASAGGVTITATATNVSYG